MNDTTKFAIEFEGIALPRQCPACGAEIDREHRMHEVANKPAQLTAEYFCGTIITVMYASVERREWRTNVSAGCRVITLKQLTDNGKESF